MCSSSSSLHSNVYNIALRDTQNCVNALLEYFNTTQCIEQIKVYIYFIQYASIMLQAHCAYYYYTNIFDIGLLANRMREVSREKIFAVWMREIFVVQEF